MFFYKHVFVNMRLEYAYVFHKYSLNICLSKNIQRQKRKFHDLNHAWGEGVGKGIKMKNLDSVPSRLLKSLAWDNN